MTIPPTSPPPLDYRPPSAPEERRLAHRLATRVVAAFFALIFAAVTLWLIVVMLGLFTVGISKFGAASERLFLLPAALVSTLGFFLCLATATGHLAPKHPWARDR